MALLTSEFARLSHNCTGSHEGCRWFSRDPNHVSQGILTLHNDASSSTRYNSGFRIYEIQSNFLTVHDYSFRNAIVHHLAGSTYPLERSNQILFKHEDNDFPR